MLLTVVPGWEALSIRGEDRLIHQHQRLILLVVSAQAGMAITRAPPWRSVCSHPPPATRAPTRPPTPRSSTASCSRPPPRPSTETTTTIQRSSPTTPSPTSPFRAPPATRTRSFLPPATVASHWRQGAGSWGDARIALRMSLPPCAPSTLADPPRPAAPGRIPVEQLGRSADGWVDMPSTRVVFSRIITRRPDEC
jgi:hypothetical protein